MGTFTVLSVSISWSAISLRGTLLFALFFVSSSIFAQTFEWTRPGTPSVGLEGQMGYVNGDALMPALFITMGLGNLSDLELAVGSSGFTGDVVVRNHWYLFNSWSLAPVIVMNLAPIAPVAISSSVELGTNFKFEGRESVSLGLLYSFWRKNLGTIGGVLPSSKFPISFVVGISVPIVHQ
jgi:hypothetical protein